MIDDGMVWDRENIERVWADNAAGFIERFFIILSSNKVNKIMLLNKCTFYIKAIFILIRIGLF
jgi:hypothetical protein